jgi:hypothetical protein
VNRCVMDGDVIMAASVLRCLGLVLLRLFNRYLQGCGSMGCLVPFVAFSFQEFLARVKLRGEWRGRLDRVLTMVLVSLMV